MNKYSVGDFIYKKRKEKNLTQTQLGEMLGVSNKAVSKWETGESFPEFSLIQPLCEILGISADELIAGKEREDFEFYGNAKENFVQTDRDVRDENEQISRDFESRYCENAETASKQQKQLSQKGLAFEKRFFVGIAVAVFLCVASLGALFLSQYFGMSEGHSACVMLSICVVAVYMFVHMGMKYDAYKKGTDDYVNALDKFTWILPIGVAMCVLSPCIILLIGSDESGGINPLAMCAFFGWLAIAVLIIVFSAMYIKRTNDFYGITEVEAKKEQWQDRACGIIMITAVMIYLILGFVFDVWHPGWIVFPIGGLICCILGTTKKNDHK